MARPGSSRPKRESTRERLLDVAAVLLAEVGMERISTNMISERAGVTPPTFYYYFADKFEVVVALGERLMERQNRALMAWIARHEAGGIEAYAANIADLLRETAEVTEADPGGVWIERALHSSPRLEHVRIASHRLVTDAIADAFVRHLPDLPRDQVWLRARMLIEFGYMTVELLHAESGLARDALLAEAATMLRLAALDMMRVPPA